MTISQDTHLTDDGIEHIPTSFNLYKYGIIKTISLHFSKGEIDLWIKSSLKRCSCWKQTPYVYKKDWYWQTYRVCGNCMSDEVKELLKEIYK